MSRYEPTLAEFQLCVTLDVLDYHTYVERVVGLKQYDGRIRMPLYDQVKLALCDWIDHLGILNMIAVIDLIETMSPDIADYVQTFGKTLDKYTSLAYRPLFVLAIHDQLYANWTCKEGSERTGQFYSLRSKMFVESMPEPAVTHLACDVTALYLRLRKKQQLLRKRKDADDSSRTDHEATSGGADRP